MCRLTVVLKNGKKVKGAWEDSNYESLVQVVKSFMHEDKGMLKVPYRKGCHVFAREAVSHVRVQR